MKATKREWIGLAVLALPCILATMDLTVLNLAVPHLSADLKPSSSQLLWIMDIYGFMIAGALITMGTLGDRIGRRKLLLMGATAFGVASVLAAFSKSAALLIVTRGLLGVAGATLAPSTLSLIRNMFHDDHERTTAISVWVTCFSVGAAIGPLLGGILLEHFWWGSVFLLNVPVMILLLILGPLLLPEFKDPQAGRLDLFSAALSLLSVLSIIYGLKKSAEHGVGLEALTSIAIGLLIGYFFVRRQKRLRDPLIDLTLFNSRRFKAALSMNLFGCLVAFGAFLFTAQYLQLVLGLSPLHAGLWSMPSSVAFIIGSMTTPNLSRRIGASNLVALGLLISALGFGGLLLVTPGSGLNMIVASIFVYSIGLAPIFTLATDLIISAAPPEKAGAAASLSESGSEFGGALGMAVLGSLGMAIYRNQLQSSLPDTLSTSAAEAARGTLGGALAVAQNLPLETERLAVMTPAIKAFTHALYGVAVVNVIVMVVMAVIAAIFLKEPTRKGI